MTDLNGLSFPTPRPDDPEDVSWALSTAESQWNRGDRAEAVKWIRRAVEAAYEAERDDRALELAKAAAELSDPRQSSEQGPPSPSHRPAALPEAPVPVAASTSSSSAMAGKASRPPPPPVVKNPRGPAMKPQLPASANRATPVQGVPAVTLDASKGPARSAPPPAEEALADDDWSAEPDQGPSSLSATSVMPVVTPNAPQAAPNATPAPARARDSSPRTPVTTSVPKFGLDALVGRGARASDPAGGAGRTSDPGSRPSAVPLRRSDPKSLAVPDPAARADALSPKPPTSGASPETARSFQPGRVSTPAMPAIRSTVPTTPGFVPGAPPSRASDPSAGGGGAAVARSSRLPPVAASSSAPLSSGIMDDDDENARTQIGSRVYSTSAKLASAAPPPQPVPSVKASQAVRVVVWRAPDGVHVAPHGTAVSAITVEAFLVALDPSADLTAWLAKE